MKAYERFLNYVPVWTTSDETSDTVPSADRELVLARMLVEEMKGAAKLSVELEVDMHQGNNWYEAK